jgi:hypothetical protein
VGGTGGCARDPESAGGAGAARPLLTGTASAEGDDGGPVPAAFVAVTVNV